MVGGLHLGNLGATPPTALAAPDATRLDGCGAPHRLEVSDRTIRNDIDRLRALGYPVHATRGSIGGYRLEAGATLPPLLLDDEEAVAVAIGLRTATGGSVTGIEETSLRALAKLEQVLPPRLRSQVNALQTYTLHIRHRPGPSVDPEPVRARGGLPRSSRADSTTPTGAASLPSGAPSLPPGQLGQRWYLVAWDIDRADWRTFRVDRMRPGMSIAPRFTPRPLTDADVEGLMSRGAKAFARRFQARVIVHTSAVDLAARIGPWVGTVTAVDERSCILETGADSLESLAAYLGLLGTDFIVDGPPELVAGVQALGERYGRATGAAPASRSRNLEMARPTLLRPVTPDEPLLRLQGPHHETSLRPDGGAMRRIGAYEAKTHLPRLLDEVAEGEIITITKHGVAVAVLGPAATQASMTRSDAIAGLRAFRRDHRLDGLTNCETIDEGRR